MSASAIDIHEWTSALRDSVLDYIHPLALDSIHKWIDAMERAADVGDDTTVARLTADVQQKIRSEVEWEEDKELSAADRSYVPRCCRGGDER